MYIVLRIEIHLNLNFKLIDAFFLGLDLKTIFGRLVRLISTNLARFEV